MAILFVLGKWEYFVPDRKDQSKADRIKGKCIEYQETCKAFEESHQPPPPIRPIQPERRDLGKGPSARPKK